ncbi:hypothetical protein BT63DRAFT_453951 [Microthyrium microscopicum]|uniref:Apple domain-containing protein n=1 Tax=Microthyrium microscopicum TaxID=703497 RepID=A0A6A6UBY6_9PEZI|nr:hypothetical protein BT63DRAFT_453951 [Microthyrium microscopicum]
MVVLPAVFLLLTSFGRVQAAPGASSLERRDNVDNAVKLLVAAKASAFCSSVIGIKDVTTTKTSVGLTSHITITDSAAPCTITAPANTLTATSIVTLSASVISTTTTLVASTSTSLVTASASTVVATSTLSAITDTSLITLSISTSTTSTTVTPDPVFTTSTATSATVVTTTITSYAPNGVMKKRATASPTCNLKNLPPVVSVFACDVIQSACSRYVQPATQTTIKTVPGSLYTSHTTARSSCITITPSSSMATTTTTVTPSAVTSVATNTPPVSQVTSTITPPAVTVTVSSQLPDSTTSVTVTPPGTVVTSTITLPASTIISTTTSMPTSTSTVFVSGTTTETNNCKAGRTPYDIDIPGITAYIDITCNAFGGNPFGSVATLTTTSFTDCVNNCLNTACDAVDWNIQTGECIEYNGAIQGPSQNYGFNHMQIDIAF